MYFEFQLCLQEMGKNSQTLTKLPLDANMIEREKHDYQNEAAPVDRLILEYLAQDIHVIGLCAGRQEVKLLLGKV